MTTHITNDAIATTEHAKGRFIARLKEELSCWTVTRADLARMQRARAAEYK